MGLETGTYISDLNANNPTAGDPKSEGDDHLRLLKATLAATFPGITGAVVTTQTEMNFVSGVTSSLQTQLGLKAPLVSPALTGVPTAPTATAESNNTQVANTAYVDESTTAATYPAASGNSGKFLTNDGTVALWDDAYPPTSGNSGKFLTNDGTVNLWGELTWEDLPTLNPPITEDTTLCIAITSDLTLYIATTGDDDVNTGLTVGSPWLTINRAFEHLHGKRISDNVTVTINVASGAYTSVANIAIARKDCTKIKIIGAGSTLSTFAFATGEAGLSLVDSEGLTVKGISFAGYDAAEDEYGLSLVRSSCMTDDVRVTGWGTGVYAYKGSYMEIANLFHLSSCNDGFYVTTNSIIQSIVTAPFQVSINCGGVSGSIGLNVQESSKAILSTISISNCGTGVSSSSNSFVDISSAMISSCPTVSLPALTTVATATPTYGQFGSWIRG